MRKRENGAVMMRILALGGAVALSALVVTAIRDTGTAQQNPPLAQTQTGPVGGKMETGQAVFLGIPYAAPPVGNLRWRAPEPAQRWTETHDATNFGASCVQAYDI